LIKQLENVILVEKSILDIAYDDRALENRYVQQLQKLTSCIQQQQNQLNILTDSIKEIAEYTIQKESEFEG